MVDFDKLNTLQQSITSAEFQELLGNSVMEASQKQKIASIFMQISKNDGELSLEDWEEFIVSIDKNKDLKINSNEIAKSIQQKENLVFKLDRKRVIDFYNIVKNHIENLSKPKLFQISSAQKVVYAPKNNYRYSSPLPYSFDENWIACDNYNSRTFEDWLANNNYVIDERTAEELSDNANKRNTRKYNKKCASAIRESLQDTTVYSAHNHFENENTDNKNDDSETKLLESFEKGKNPSYAYQYASILANNPHFREIPHNIVESMDLSQLPKGCVIVYDANYKTSRNKDGSINYHKAGHIAVADGTGYDSGGGYYKIADKKQSTHIRVFVPIINKQQSVETIPSLQPLTISDIIEE